MPFFIDLSASWRRVIFLAGFLLGVSIVALIINAFIGAVVLLLILRLIGGGWGRRRWI